MLFWFSFSLSECELSESIVAFGLCLPIPGLRDCLFETSLHSVFLKIHQYRNLMHWKVKVLKGLYILVIIIKYTKKWFKTKEWAVVG